MSLQRTQKAAPQNSALSNPYDLYQRAVRIGPLKASVIKTTFSSTSSRSLGWR